MELSKRRIITDSQLNLMLDFLEAHPDLAMGSNRHKDIRALSKNLWLECAEILNAEGPTRTPREWSKVWIDYKHRVRSKLAGRNAGSTQGLMLSPMEKRVSDTFFAKVLASNSGQADPGSAMDSMTYESNEEFEEQSKRRSVTIPQWELMLDFLESHLDLALGRTRTKEDSAVAKKLWLECTEILNAKGPARTAREWTKTWNILKHRVKAKLVLRNAHPERRGCKLSRLEERVSNFFDSEVVKEVDPLADNGREERGSDGTIFETDEEKRLRNGRKYVTVRQMEVMLDFLESHPDVALSRARTKEDRLDAEKLWSDCAERVNAEGPSRTGKEWSRVWIDYKVRMKGKLATLQGDRPSDGSVLSPLEKRTLSVITDKVDTLVNNEHSYSVTCEENEEKKNWSVRKSTTVRQLKLLLDFLEPHREVALGRNRSRECRADAVKVWRECAKILNAEGPPRTPRQWVKVWNDYKARARSKLRHRNAILRRDGPSRAPVLSPLETRVINTYIVRKANPLANNLQELSSNDVRRDTMTLHSNKDHATTLSSIIEAEFQPTLEVSRATSSPVPSESYEIVSPTPSETHEIPSPVPSETHRITQEQSESHGISAPVKIELYEIASSVPSESQGTASPVPSESYEISSQVKIESYDIASSVKSESYEIPSPVPSEYHAIPSPVPIEYHAIPSTVPREYHARASPMPSESHAIPSPVPSKYNAIASPVPSEYHATPSPIPSEYHATPSPVPSESHGIASLVPSASGQFPSPSSGPNRVMRARKRQRRAARSSHQSSKAAEEARMILLEIEDKRTEIDLRNAHTISGALEYLKSISTSLDRLTNMFSQRHHTGATGVGAAGTGVVGARSTGTGDTGTGVIGAGGSGTGGSGTGVTGTGAMGT